MKIKYENLQLPDQAGNSGKYLTTDGSSTSWAAATGGAGVTDGDKGDITISGTGTVYTIDNNAVTLAKMAQIATQTILGRTTASTGNVEALTATQLTAMLDTFTSLLKGLVPASGGGTTNFLRADGTWAAPPGGTSSARVVSLTDGATIAVNADTTDVGTVTIAGNRTVSNPTGTPVDGQRIELRVKQDATGGRTISWGTSYRFGTDITSTTLSPTPSKTDYILFIYNSADSKWDCRSIVRGY